MEKTKINKHVLLLIKKVYDKRKKILKKDFDFFKPCKDLLEISKYLDCSPRQAFIYSIIFINCLDGNQEINFNNFCLNLKKLNLKIAKWNDDFIYLLKKNLIICKDNTYIFNSKFCVFNKSFGIFYDNVYNIVNNKKLEINNIEKNVFTDLKNIYKCIISKISWTDKFYFFEKVFLENKEKSIFSYFKKYSNNEYKDFENISISLFFFVVYNTYFHDKINLSIKSFFYILYEYHENIESFNHVLQKLLKCDYMLFNNGYLKKENATLYQKDEMCVCLTKKSIDLLKEYGIDIKRRPINESDIILFKKIKEKNLFYNEYEKIQLSNIEKSLHNENFLNIQKKLESKNMPNGINILLYGAPGTGKTEFVYQIAKTTNRNIYKVDISQIQAMWLGESEKNIKAIFTKYESLKENEENCPILMFNEADGILQKRDNKSSVSEVYNRCQNILLEEFENFNGIFFATTNLTKNLDSAFERRFLFKVEFNKPIFENKVLIWKDKLPQLDDCNIIELAKKYEFSGGEINNIVRKCHIHELTEDKNLDFETILNFCNNELIKTDIRKIGFNIK